MSCWILLCIPKNSLFHAAEFVSHTVKYISHTVVFVSHSVGQRNYPEVLENTQGETEVFTGVNFACHRGR